LVYGTLTFRQAAICSIHSAATFRHLYGIEIQLGSILPVMADHPPVIKILVVDDDRAMSEMLRESLVSEIRQVQSCDRPSEALAELATTPFDLVITDLRMAGGVDGIDLCRRIVSQAADVPVIVLTAFGDYDTAVAAMRAGAYDFLSKPVKLDVLELAVTRALEHRHLHREVKRLATALSSSSHLARSNDEAFASLVGSSPAMDRVFRLLTRIASSSDTSVLITGESGTGKELVARALHDKSPRKHSPFVAINCAAMPEALLESELFGHEKGAFTDAKTARAGLFVEANGGTIFLDEIGELPLALQPKLLRALQERSVRPIGGRKEIPFDVRLIAATNRDLENAIEEGRFREDLFFRLNVIEVPLPPLRERGNDVLALAQHFLARFAARAKKNIVGLTPPVAKHLLEYNWPGNVRELHNVMERAVALAANDHITAFDLSDKITRFERKKPRAPIPLDLGELVTLEEMERRYILHVLEASNGSRNVAARTLGLDRTTLWRRLERIVVEKK
jgi:two-component system, NtrC family, response regulator AtoC